MRVLDSGGGEGDHTQGVQSVWAPPGYGELLQIPGEGDLGGGRLLVGGSPKPGEGAGVLAEDDIDHQQGGDGAAGVLLFV